MIKKLKAMWQNFRAPKANCFLCNRKMKVTDLRKSYPHLEYGYTPVSEHRIHILVCKDRRECWDNS